MEIHRVIDDDGLRAARAIRRTVFIEEQNVPEDEEWDGRDGDCTHFLAIRDGTPIGTARVMQLGDVAKIQRVCVLAEARGAGVGAALIAHILADDALRATCTTAKLGSQTHAIPFYERLGFTASGPEYLDAGIPHRDMTRPMGAT